MNRTQKDLRHELIHTHKMPEIIFSAILDRMKRWAAANPDQLISHQKSDLIAAWVYTMGRPGASAADVASPGPGYVNVLGEVTDMKMRNSFRICSTFNASMRMAEPRKAEPEYQWINYHLRNAVKHLTGAQEGQTLYRGQPELYSQAYKAGDIVQWMDYKSTSTDEAIAAQLAGEGGFMMYIEEGVTENLGASFGNTNPPLSAWPEKAEILLPAGATFQVLTNGPAADGSGRTHISLRFLGEWVDTEFKESEALPMINHHNNTVVSASGLRKTDFYGGSDPYAIVYVDGVRVGDTPHVSSSLDPVFRGNIFREQIVQHYISGILKPPQRPMKVRIELKDFDDAKPEEDDDFLGQVEFVAEGDQVLFEKRSLKLVGSAEFPDVDVAGEVVVEMTKQNAPTCTCTRFGKSASFGPQREPEAELDEPEPKPEPLRERGESHAYPTESEIAQHAAAAAAQGHASMQVVAEEPETELELETETEPGSPTKPTLQSDSWKALKQKVN